MLTIYLPYLLSGREVDHAFFSTHYKTLMDILGFEKLNMTCGMLAVEYVALRKRARTIQTHTHTHTLTHVSPLSYTYIQYIDSVSYLTF